MISSYFIDRPVFACVISIIITLIGIAALRILPVEQYPDIAPPVIQVTAVYPGADASTVATSVAAPLEQQINGAEHMLYMTSQNAATGEMSLTIFFDIGTNIDMAQVDVQNRANMALPQLPTETQQIGVTVRKQTPSFLMAINIQSPTGQYDELFLSNYSTINIVDELLRVPGVSNAQVFNARDYSMRVWLKPDRMAQLGLTTGDVVSAIREQNSNFAAGQIGMAPMTKPTELTLPIAAKGRLSEPDEFDDIILRSNTDGSVVQVKDIGHSELGAKSYDVSASLNGKTTIAIAVFQQFGTNALQVAEDVRSTMERLSKNFPEGVVYSIPYDTTKYIDSSIKEVIKTIFEAAILVALVVLVFLQKVRAMLIPTLAMIVSIVGSFAGMYLLGFSVNTLTLFGLVLAVGTVVDDAIVVIENIERNIRELGLSSYEAAHRAMAEVEGPVIAIVFVLCAVFIPVAFVGGIAGQLYKQFAITIAVSVIISGVVALTLTPALAVVLLKKQSKESRLAAWFNRQFEKLTNGYLRCTEVILKRSWIGLLLFGSIIAILVVLIKFTPTSFVPDEDQGYLIGVVDLPDGASLERTEKVDEQFYQVVRNQPGVDEILSFSGFSMLDGVPKSSTGVDFVTLIDWSKRKSPELQLGAIQGALMPKLSKIPEGQIFLFNPPPVPGLGTIGGFEFWIQNRADMSMVDLESAIDDMIKAAQNKPELAYLTTTVQANNLQLFANLDRFKAKALGVPISEIFQTLQLLMSSLYVNDFNKFGRTFRVTVQADPAYRSTVDSIDDMYVRSVDGTMIPLTSLVSIDYHKGPSMVSRFNGFLAGRVMGSAAPGYSSGQAMKAVEDIAKEVLPEGMTLAWSGQALQEKTAGDTSQYILLSGILMVFLILCALYERWSLPFAIILAIPLGLFGAFLAVWLRGTSNDVYFQVGLVTLVALAAKNAILIVEFAIHKYDNGMGLLEATLEASKLRFRAILMTSLTFILGVVPLVISSGAGAASRHSVGTGVFGGMIAATVFAVLLVPLFFKLIVQTTSRKGKDEVP